MTGDPENAAAAPDDGVDAASAQAVAPERRMRNVEALLRARGGSFGLFQAIRLLELRDSRRTPPGAFADPSREVVRLSQNPSLASAAREVEALELAEEGPDRLTTNVFGLVGAMGVLPHPYSAVVLDRGRARDHTARDFLDIFQHRFISLLYAAWRKGKPELALERGDDDEHLHHLLDLMGMGHEPDEAFPGVDRETLGWYMGLLAVPTRSAPALEQLLGDRFGVGVRVEPFVGGWLRLDSPDHCRLGEDTEADVLGGGAVVGDEVWDPHARIRVRMGPLSRAAFDRLLPGSEDHDALRRLVRFFTHDAFDVELQLVLRHDEVAGTTLAAHSSASSPLGWGTWLASRPRAEDGDETTFKL